MAYYPIRRAGVSNHLNFEKAFFCCDHLSYYEKFDYTTTMRLKWNSEAISSRFAVYSFVSAKPIERLIFSLLLLMTIPGIM